MRALPLKFSLRPRTSSKTKLEGRGRAGGPRRRATYSWNPQSAAPPLAPTTGSHSALAPQQPTSTRNATSLFAAARVGSCKERPRATALPAGTSVQRAAIRTTTSPAPPAGTSQLSLTSSGRRYLRGGPTSPRGVPLSSVMPSGRKHGGSGPRCHTSRAPKERSSSSPFGAIEKTRAASWKRSMLEEAWKVAFGMPHTRRGAACGGATKSAAELELMARRYDLICTPAAAETNGLSSGPPPLKPVSGPYASRRVHSSAFGGGDGAATSLACGGASASPRSL
mmetsp:Transcript_20210/g.60520  ORF Transcript_20210/g.60520 Transcript_20210/m.60520 type:complete len:281 (-) Transcript_20210:1551-2393(-)